MPKLHKSYREPEGLSKVRKALGSPPPPKSIRQEPWDFDPAHLVRLSRLQPGEKASFDDLWHYSQDLNYGDIDGEFLRYCLPFCLAGWHRYVIGQGEEYGGFVEYFYPALLKLFPSLRKTEVAAIAEFMRDAILSLIEGQQSLECAEPKSGVHRWIYAFTTHGVLFPDIAELWVPLWKAESPGRAVATVQYASCLIYREADNPVFSQWNPTEGGGAPGLWTYEGHLYTQSWLQPNLEFLRSTLKPASVRDSLDRAVSTLAGHPQHSRAVEVRRSCDTHWATLVRRCAELPEFLSRDQRGLYLEWSK